MSRGEPLSVRDNLVIFVQVLVAIALVVGLAAGLVQFGLSSSPPAQFGYAIAAYTLSIVSLLAWYWLNASAWARTVPERLDWIETILYPLLLASPALGGISAALAFANVLHMPPGKNSGILLMLGATVAWMSWTGIVFLFAKRLMRSRHTARKPDHDAREEY